MEFTHLCASFGRLEQAELTLYPGLNILEAPNETGKSTWAALIRAMLYGIKTGRVKGAELPDRQRYQPWSGAAMAGELELIRQGESVTLRRVSPGGGRPMGEAAAVLSGTGERIPALCGPAPGETLLGVSESVYRRSAFISGTELTVDADAQLERRILNLVSSGEEESAWSEVDQRLRRWQHKRRYRNTGELPAAEAELQAVRDALRELEEKNSRIARLYEEKNRLTAQLTELETELRRHNRDQRLESRLLAEENHRAACERAEAAAERRRALERETARFTPDALRRLSEADTALEAAEAAAAAGAERRQRRQTVLEALRSPEKRPGVWRLCLPVCACLGLFAGIPAVPRLLRWLVPLIGLLLLSAGVLLTQSRKRRLRNAALRQAETELAEAEQDLAAMNARRDAAARELAACRNALGGKDDRSGAELRIWAEARLSACREAVLTERQAWELADRLLPPALPPSADDALTGDTRMSRAEAEARMTETRAELEKTVQAIAYEEGSYAHLGDPLVLSTRQKTLQEKIAGLTGEYAALELAAEVMETAHARMEAQVSPLVSRRAAELLRGMTDSRYDKVYFDRELHFTVHRPEEITPRELEYLSQGARNQVYLAVRLALSELVLPGDEPCPLVLDDVLVSFDDARAKNTLRLLQELGRQRQILLFTCQSRENRLLRELNEELLSSDRI